MIDYFSHGVLALWSGAVPPGDLAAVRPHLSQPPDVVTRRRRTSPRRQRDVDRRFRHGCCEIRGTTPRSDLGQPDVLTMTLAAPKAVDHGVNFMIAAIGVRWRGRPLPSRWAVPGTARAGSPPTPGPTGAGRSRSSRLGRRGGCAAAQP